MGVFQDLVEVINRCPWPLTIRFDGQEETLQPGKNMIPRISLLHALNQNPQMGTGDVNNPNVAGCQYLIGIPEKANKYPCEPFTVAELKKLKDSPSRFDFMPLMEGKLGKHDKIEVRGRKAPSSFEAKGRADLETARND